MPRSVFDEDVLPHARTSGVRDGEDAALHHFEELPRISLTLDELGDPFTSYWPQFVLSGTSLADSVGRSDSEQKISEVSSVLAQYKFEVLDVLKPIPVAPNAVQTSTSVSSRIENRNTEKGSRGTKIIGNSSVDLASITGLATHDNECEDDEEDALDTARLARGRDTETIHQGKIRPLRPSTAPAQREDEPTILEAGEAIATNGGTADAKGSAEQRGDLSREDFFDAYDYAYHEVFLKFYRFRRLELFLADLLVRQASCLVSTASAQSSSQSTVGVSPSRLGARVWKRSLSPIQHRSNSSSGVAATTTSKRPSSAFPQESPLEQVLELLAAVDELTADPIILPSALCARDDTNSANAPTAGKQGGSLFQNFLKSTDKSVQMSERGGSATIGTRRDTLTSASAKGQTEKDLPPLPPNPKDHIAKQILDSKLEVHAGYFLNYLRRTTRIEMLKVLTLTRRRKAQLELEEALGPAVRGRLGSATNASPGRRHNASSLSTSSGLAVHHTSVSAKLALQSAGLAVEIADCIDCPHLLPELLLNKGTIESSLKLFPDSLESGIAAHAVVADVMANIQKALKVAKNKDIVVIEESDGINDRSSNESDNSDNKNNSVADSRGSQSSEVSSYSSTIKRLAKKAKLLVARRSRAVTNLCTTSPQSLQNYLAWQEHRRLSLEIAVVEEKLQRYSSLTEKAKLRRHAEESNDSSFLDESAIRPSLHDLRRVSVATASPTEPPLGRETKEERYESFNGEFDGDGQAHNNADGDGGVRANPFDSSPLQQKSFKSLGQQGNPSSSSGVVAASKVKSNSSSSGSAAFNKRKSAALTVSPVKAPLSAAIDTIPLSFVVELDESEERHITPLRYLLWASTLIVTERESESAAHMTSTIANPKKKVQAKGQGSVSQSRTHYFPALELLLEEESKSKSCPAAKTPSEEQVQAHPTKQNMVGKPNANDSQSSSARAGERELPSRELTTISLKQALRTWGGVLALVYRHIGVVTRLLGDFEGSLKTLVVANATAEQFLAETDDIAVLCKQAMLEAREEYEAQKRVHHAASIITRERHYSDGKPTFPKSSYYASDGGGTSSSFMAQQKRRIARPEWNQSFVSTIPPSAAMAEQQRLADREMMRNYAKTREEEKARKRRIQQRMRLLLKSATTDGGDGHLSDVWNDDEGDVTGPRGDAFAASIGFSIRPSTAGEYFRRRPLTANSTAGGGGGGGDVDGGSINDRAGLSPVTNDGSGVEADATISSAYDTVRGRFALSSPLSRGTTRKPKRVTPSPLPSESHSGGSTPVARSASNKANKGINEIIGALPHLNIKKMQSQSQQLNSQSGTQDTDILDFFNSREDQRLTMADIAYLRQVHRLKWDPTTSFSRQNRYGSAANDASPFFRDGGRLRPPTASQK